MNLVLTELEYKVIDSVKEVFDEQGNIKLCGRYACMNLINEINELTLVKEKSSIKSLEELKALATNINFGDVNTGFINISELKSHNLEGIIGGIFNEIG